jgi:hypothetical protein
MIFQFIKKRWGIGCLTGLIIGVWVFVGYVRLMPAYFDNTQYYSTCYTREDIKNVTGVEIPEFKIIDIYFQRDFFKKKIKHTIEFKTIPDDSFFYMLDSICAVSQGYGNDGYWSKNENKYSFSLSLKISEYKYQPYFLDLFSLSITKGGKQAKISYGEQLIF